MPINAMITEDDPLSKAILCDLLEDYFPDVHIICMAETVKESVAFLTEHKIDLLFLDIELPDGKGFDILTGFENLELGVIVTTSYASYAGSEKFCNLVDFLVKPVTRQTLSNAIGMYNQQLHTHINYNQQLHTHITH